ncbi:hypothetical protein M8542_49200 [Amycolatopsis sp. OK19-0408]|uniref:Uncharacterized protein n=1 Tax=Amycolatopsis iheyensis TaxID=2945988 RepID=A0A9X2SQ70_9PSEU|nr:hypothetical protein [Amycolatopsis iheyensis]MCR6490794.1 hypothetical protein [Amycolatopsis iheyensis]
MPYTHFRYIAYEVPTATTDLNLANGPTLAGLPPGKLCDPVPDIPVKAPLDQSADWFIRLRRLATMVHMAERNVQELGDDSTTLKVFVAPEFYLRPADATAHHTYDVEQYQEVWGALEQMFRAVRLTNWLIAPGSVLWHSDTMDVTQRTFYNTVWFTFGGARKGESRRVEKRLASHIDGVPQQFAVGSNPRLQGAYEDREFARERLLEIGGQAIAGFEICLDHGDQVLKKTVAELQNDPQDPWKNGGPALHVLTAGGMPLDEEAIVARPGGYLLRNDGYANDPYSELRRVTGYALQSGAPANAWTDKAIATLAPDPGVAKEVVLKGESLLVPRMPGQGNYYMSPQRLRIYPKLAMP